MKSATDLLHKTPWWALIFGGLATLAALAAFVTPYHILQYREVARSAEESRAIKREIDNTFAENAINLGRGVIKGMLARTTDPQRREELEQALQGLEEARGELREAGREVLRAKRESLSAARQATREMRAAVRNAQKQAQRALKNSGPEGDAALKSLENSLKEAEAAEREAEQSLKRAERSSRIVIPGKDGKPRIDVQIDPATPGPVAPAPLPGGEAAPVPPAPELPPEVATKIRRDVTGDMYRIGIGAGLILILVPLFIVAVVVKFFVGRSRAAQRVAETKRKEADYHRMSQQVTEAKLAALQAQVEPHFLYNTLASVQALTEVDPAKASEMTGHLIHYLRNALPKMRESVSTVGQEVELARAYLNILQMRMGKRLTFDIDVPEALMQAPFPPLMLPSLVENAIKHGLEPQREGGHLRIGASEGGGQLRLVVSDTGRGFSETPGTGVGLANIRERLAALYGGAAHLTLEANQPQGVVATIDVPLAGTRSAAASAAPQASTSTPASPPPPQPAPVSTTASEIPRIGFWARTWEVLVAIERVWRKVLYYFYIALVILTGVVIIAAIVAYAFGEFPVQFGDQMVSGPAGGLIVLAGGVIGFVAAAAGLAIAMLVMYAVGYVLLAVLVIVALAVALAVFPAAAPFILVGLFVWWLMKRNKASRPPPAPRVEPTVAGPGS